MTDEMETVSGIVEDSVTAPTSDEPTKEPEFPGCDCTSPWCTAVVRLQREDLNSVRVYGGQLFATVSNDHVEKCLGAYGE